MAPHHGWDFKRTFTMGLVEEKDTPIDIEKEDLHEAANANFVGDRENIPCISNRNTFMNSFKMKDDLTQNGRQPHPKWNTTSPKMEDNLP